MNGFMSGTLVGDAFSRLFGTKMDAVGFEGRVAVAEHRMQRDAERLAKSSAAEVVVTLEGRLKAGHDPKKPIEISTLVYDDPRRGVVSPLPKRDAKNLDDYRGNQEFHAVYERSLREALGAVLPDMELAKLERVGSMSGSCVDNSIARYTAVRLSLIRRGDVSLPRDVFERVG